jgi:oligosaccharide repeat unit polymerase
LFHSAETAGAFTETGREVRGLSWISWISFAICFGIVLASFRREADLLSPARVFGFIWCLAVGLTELKLSRFQHEWNSLSWFLLLIGIAAYLVGILIAHVLNIGKKLVPLGTMRVMLKEERLNEDRLFKIIILSFVVYAVSYLVIYFVKGFLPIFVVGTKTSRVDFYVFGFGVLINSPAFIIFFTLLYHLLVPECKARKRILTIVTLIAVGSYSLLLQRFEIIMAAVICFALLYYATHRIRLKTVIPLVLAVTGFFYWIASLRLGNLVATYTYYSSRMKFPIAYALLTEPYMYVVMNLENFARSVNRLDHFTYGYFTFDFIGAAAGLKYWISDYFGLDRTPYLVSGYNTYTAFWSFYRDFGVPGLALIPLLLGFGTGMFYYRMRSRPSIKNVTAYGIMVFVMFISYFNFPIAFLWFEYNVLALYWFLRWTIVPRPVSHQPHAPLEPGLGRILPARGQ